MEPSIDAEATYDPVNFSFPHGTHICAMEVDTETGMVKIRKYACVDDIGKIVNPLIVEGQVHGGLAQGIAQALYEEAVYDADGNLTTGTFVDYLVPSAADLPHFDTGNTVHEAPGNPIGAKGVGEAGCIASHPRGRQRRAGRRPAPGGERHPHATHTGTGLAGDASGRRRRWPGHRGNERLRRRPDRDHGRCVHRRFLAGRGPMIPAAFAYARPTSSTRRSRPSPRAARTSRSWPAGSR